jgi:tetratricopeptide (TPR) repeat protein
LAQQKQSAPAPASSPASTAQPATRTKARQETAAASEERQRLAAIANKRRERSAAQVKAKASGPAMSQKAKRLYEQGVKAYQAGNLSVAVRMLERAMKLEPGSVAVRFSLGWALFERGDYQDAAEQFQEILKLRPGDSEAQSALEMAQRAISSMGGGGHN